MLIKILIKLLIMEWNLIAQWKIVQIKIYI